MSVLTFKSDEFKTFPLILRDYATYTVYIKGNSEKSVCEYLLDLRTFFRFMLMRDRGEELSREEFEAIEITSIDLEYIRKVGKNHGIKLLH